MKKAMMFAGAAALGAAAMNPTGQRSRKIMLAMRGLPNQGRRAAHGDSVAARELELYIDNTYSLYKQKQSVQMNLLRKVKKGTYDPAQAPKLWMYFVDNGAKDYAKGYSQSWHAMFPKPTREMVAVEFAKEFDSDLRYAGGDKWPKGSWEALAELYGVLGERGLKPTGQRSRKIWLGMQGLPNRHSSLPSHRGGVKQWTKHVRYMSTEKARRELAWAKKELKRSAGQDAKDLKSYIAALSRVAR